jgi:hypothetical protein
MPVSDVRAIVAKIIEAHGGAAHWQMLETVEAVISVYGFLFKAKRRPTLDHIRVRASTREPRFAFYDYPVPGQNTEFLGDAEVRITGAENQVIASRLQPRGGFRGFRRRLYWDALDFAYFGGYATWNYLVTPFIFLSDIFLLENLDTTTAGSEYPLRIKVNFPADLPTHSRTQVFYFDSDYLLRRLDYTAEVVGRWARAAHLCENYRDFDGFMIPTKRRVLPLFIGKKPMPAPIIVAIDIHEFIGL